MVLTQYDVDKATMSDKKILYQTYINASLAVWRET